MSNALNLGSIVLPGDNYPSIHGFNIPVTSGLEGAFLFGDGVAQMGRNYAPGKPDATVVGAPVSGAGFGVFNEFGYLNTGISETAEMTIITVCRDSSGLVDPKPGFIGNHLDVPLGGVAIFTATETLFRGQNVKNNLSDYCSVSANGTVATFTPLAFRVKNNATSLLTNLTSGAAAGSASSGARTVDSANKILVGRIPSEGFKGLNDQVAALIYSRAITDAELTSMTVWLRKYCASHGIVV